MVKKARGGSGVEDGASHRRAQANCRQGSASSPASLWRQGLGGGPLWKRQGGGLPALGSQENMQALNLANSLEAFLSLLGRLGSWGQSPKGNQLRLRINPVLFHA